MVVIEWSWLVHGVDVLLSPFGSRRFPVGWLCGIAGCAECDGTWGCMLSAVVGLRSWLRSPSQPGRNGPACVLPTAPPAAATATRSGPAVAPPPRRPRCSLCSARPATPPAPDPGPGRRSVRPDPDPRPPGSTPPLWRPANAVDQEAARRRGELTAAFDQQQAQADEAHAGMRAGASAEQSASTGSVGAAAVSARRGVQEQASQSQQAAVQHVEWMRAPRRASTPMPRRSGSTHVPRRGPAQRASCACRCPQPTRQGQSCTCAVAGTRAAS